MDEFDKDEISTVSWAKMSDVLNIPDIDYMIPKHGEMFRQMVTIIFKEYHNLAIAKLFLIIEKRI